MKPLPILAAAALAVLHTATAAHDAPSPLAGTWTLDLASMPIPPEYRPASVTVEFAETSDGLWQTSYLIMGKDGSERRMISRQKPGGGAVAIEGDQLEADSVVLSHPLPGVLVMGLAKAGRPGSVRVYTVGPDGATMTESAANVGDDGQPYIRSFRWTRATPPR